MKNNTLHIGSLELGSRPAIAAIVECKMPIGEVKGLAARGAATEFRYNLCPVGKIERIRPFS